jgi:hypothetical protein
MDGVLDNSAGEFKPERIPFEINFSNPMSHEV